MAFQVGSSCYASAVDAGRAACSAFEPVSTITGSIVKTASCYGSSPVSGALNLMIATTDTAAIPPSTTFVAVSHLLSYSPCVQNDYLAAAEVVAGGLLSLWVMWICGRMLLNWMGWSRGLSND